MTFHSAHGVGRCQPSAGTPATAARSMARPSSRTCQPVKVISLMICRAGPPSGGAALPPSRLGSYRNDSHLLEPSELYPINYCSSAGAPCSLARRGSPNATANEQASSPAVASAVHSAALR